MKKLLLIIAITTAALYPAAPIMIPLTDSQVYDYLEYLNTSKVINIPFTGIKPYRSDEIYELLKEIGSPDRRTANFIDRFEERYISAENKFGSDISNRISAWFDPYLNQSHVWQKASDKPLYQNINTYSYLKPRHRDLNYTFPDISQPVTDGGIRGYIGFGDHISLFTESGVMIKHGYQMNAGMRDEYRTLVLVPSGGLADFSSEDYTMTAFTVSGEDIYLSFGKYPVSMGSGMINSVTLSAMDAYYENFMFSFGGKRVRFTTLTGFLLADHQTRTELEDWRTNKRPKFLSAHRLEWKALESLTLGISEVIISGNRPIEPGYLFPVLPLRWMEHYYGDHDNALVSFDFAYHPFRNLRFYGELAIDDESFTQSWTKNYVNKWAISGGLHNTDFLTIDGLSFNFEYTRVEPYVYSHKFIINRYMNLDYFLSIPAGPDSETINFKFKYHFDYDRHITAGYTRENRGEPMWGKWNAPNYTTDIKTFLRGTVEKTNRYFTNLHYRYNKYLSADIYYSHTRTDNYNHNLPPYEESDTPPEKILQNYTNNTFSLTLNMIFKNYLSNFFRY
jgi:hypothetical protein